MKKKIQIDFDDIKDRLANGEVLEYIRTKSYIDIAGSTFRYRCAKEGIGSDARINRRKSKVDAAIEPTDGFSVKGVSTMIDSEGEVRLQWIKTDRDKDLQYKMMLDAVNSLSETVSITERIPYSVESNSKLLTNYILTDMHLGLLAHRSESGNDVDTKIVYNNTLTAMNLLINTSPDSEIAIISDLGDTLHSANDDNRTKSGHVLDIDGRHSKIFLMAVKLKIAMIELALQKHKNVVYIAVAGNHSDLVSIYIKAVLEAKFENNPRFCIHGQNTIHQYYHFGNVLLGYAHGHTGASKNLPSVMIQDNINIVSETKYRFFHSGHYHSQKVIDDPLCLIEHHRNLTNNDFWSQAAGFRTNKQMTSITYHKEYGEWSRNIASLAEVEDYIRSCGS